MRIILILLLSLVSMTVIAENTVVSNEPNISVVCPENEYSTEQTEDIELAKRGCCSWHGGVCGCSGSSAKCCDGTTSPSCGCYGNMAVG